MEEPELMALVSQTSLLMEQFERRCATIDEKLGQTRQSLDALTLQVPGVVQRSADGSLRDLPSQVMTRLREGLDRTIGEYERRLESAARSVEEHGRTFSEQMRRSERLHRAMLWKIVGAAGGSIALLLVASIWLSSYYARVIRENQLGADLLRAYNAADVVLCGDAKLCANVNHRGQKLGAKGQYLPVNPR